MIGRTLGNYHVTAKLGQGGMGEVYRATDSKLKREVATAHIYGIEGGTAEDGTAEDGTAKAVPYALVMEPVEGEDLAERLRRGPIAIDEALPIAKQIAEALEAAQVRARRSRFSPAAWSSPPESR